MFQRELTKQRADATEEMASDRQLGPNCPQAQLSPSPQARADAWQENLCEVGFQVQCAWTSLRPGQTCIL